MFERFAVMLLILLAFAIIFMVSKLIKYYEEKKLRKLVSWSVIGDYCPTLGRYSYISGLSLAIRHAQCDDDIDAKYRITEEIERQYMDEIIEEFQKHMARSYFEGHLKLMQSKYEVSGEHYFMMAMCKFLDSHQCDPEFFGNDMRQELLEHKTYGGGGSDATYSLSDFGILYHKMYYITYMFCKKSKIANPKGDCFQNEKSIKDIIDTKTIQIVRYQL